MNLNRRTREFWDSASLVGYLPLFILGLPVTCGVPACTVGYLPAQWVILWAFCQFCGLLAYSVGYLPGLWANCMLCGLPAYYVGYLPALWAFCLIFGLFGQSIFPAFFFTIQFLTSCMHCQPEILQQLNPFFELSLTQHLT